MREDGFHSVLDDRLEQRLQAPRRNVFLQSLVQSFSGCVEGVQREMLTRHLDTSIPYHSCARSQDWSIGRVCLEGLAGMLWRILRMKRGQL